MKKLITVISLISTVANATDLPINPIHLKSVKPNPTEWLALKKENCDRLGYRYKNEKNLSHIEFEEYKSCFTDISFSYKIDYSKIKKLSIIQQNEVNFQLPIGFLHDFLDIGDESIKGLLVEPTDPTELLTYSTTIENIASTLRYSIAQYGQATTIARAHLAMFFPAVTHDLTKPISFEEELRLPESTRVLYERFKQPRPIATIDKSKTHNSNLNDYDNCSVQVIMTNKNPYSVQSTVFSLNATNHGRSTVVVSEKFVDDTIIKPNQTVKICFNLTYMNTNLMPTYDVTNTEVEHGFNELK